MRLKEFGEIHITVYSNPFELNLVCRLFFLKKHFFIYFHKEIVSQIKRKREVDVKVLHLIKLTCSFRRYT